MGRSALASRDVLLDVADRVFTRHGYGATSLRQLMSEVGMSPTAFYARYRSKEAVLEALIGRLGAQLFKVASTALTSTHDAEARVDAIANGIIAELKPHKTVVRLALTEAPVLASVNRSLHAAYSAIARLLATYLGEQGVPDASTTGWSAFGAAYIQIMRWCVFEELDDEALATELRTAVRSLHRLLR